MDRIRSRNRHVRVYVGDDVHHSVLDPLCHTDHKRVVSFLQEKSVKYEHL